MFAAAQLVSGLFGLGQQSSMLTNQQALNEQVFQQNRKLAQEQNAMNIAQWQRENNYNLPINQIKRLKDANLNPSLMYGNGTSGLTSAQSPTMSAGTPKQTTDLTMGGNRKTIGDVVQSSLDKAMQLAQIKNLEAQSNKLKSETIGIDINNSTLYDMNMAEIQKRLSEVGLNNKQVEGITQDIEQSKVYVEDLRASVAERFANIDNMTFQQFRSMLQYELDKNLNEATIKQITENTRLTTEQITQIKKTLPLVMEKYSAEISKLNSESAVNAQEANRIIGEIALNVAKEANIDANTQAINIANIRSKDEAQRYENMWGFNKDILFALKEIFGTLPIAPK